MINSKTRAGRRAALALMAAVLMPAQVWAQSAQGFPFWKPLFMGWYIATPSRRLPASTCHRQLGTDTGVERFVPPLLAVRRISRRTCCN